MSVGRGRGIRRDTQATSTSPQINNETQDRAPVRWQSPLDALAILIAVLDTDDAQQLKEVELAITRYCTDVEKMRLLIDDLHERSLSDTEFGVRAASSLATASLLVVEDTKLRGVLIHNLQNDFLQSAKLRTENQPRFLNAVAFLAEVFQRVRIADGLPIAVLAVAHFLYQKMLLEGNENEHELFVKLWSQHGAQLQKSHPTEFNDLLMATHTALIEDTASSNVSRAWLLLAIHIYHHDFQPIAHEYVGLYEATLDKDALAMLQHVLSTNTLVHSVKRLTVSKQEVEPPRDVVSNGDRGSVFNRLGLRAAENERRPAENERRSVDNERRPVENERRPVENERRSAENERRQGKGGPPRDKRNDSANWLPKPVPSEADIDNWGLDRGGRRSHATSGHDDRCDRDYYATTRNGQQGGRDNRNKAGNLKEAARQVIPDDESWD